MPIHTVKLLNRREVANNIWVFDFNKPEGFTFIPGQYAGFTLINPPEKDAGGITRRFSLLNTPTDMTISIATRIQNSAYKRVLHSLAIGDEIKLAGPTGTFTLHEDLTMPAILIAGGIGITPFYSMIRDATLKHSIQKLILFYGNHAQADTAFLDDLNSLQTQNPQFQYIPTFVNPPENWQGETGYVTAPMIKKYLPTTNVMFYICGSPVMVTTLQEAIAEMGIDENFIKVEDFPGY